MWMNHERTFNLRANIFSSSFPFRPLIDGRVVFDKEKMNSSRSFPHQRLAVPRQPSSWKVEVNWDRFPLRWLLSYVLPPFYSLTHYPSSSFNFLPVAIEQTQKREGISIRRMITSQTPLR
jgi:hypothetical protein